MVWMLAAFCLLSYTTQNSFLYVSFDKEGIINVFIKAVLP